MMEMNWIKGDDGRLTIKWTEVRNTPSRLMARGPLAVQAEAPTGSGRNKAGISIRFTRPTRLASANSIG